MNDSFGSLIAAEVLETRIPNAVAWRLRYWSADVNGRSHEVTGMVVTPLIHEGPLPIVTWCHGTTGLGDAACPSAQDDPARSLSLYFSEHSEAQIDFGVPGLAAWIDAGFIICATDYQGLGSPGVHHYPVARTNARDALAIVHAAREFLPFGGSSLATFGWSQGGAAAGAVAELPDADFRDLRLIACAAMSPGVVAASSASPAADLASLSESHVAPSAHLLMSIYGHAAAFPHLDLDDMLTPLGRAIMDQLWNSQPVHHLADSTSRLFALKGPLMHGNPLTHPDWREALLTGSAGRIKPRCEVLVCMDDFEGGGVVPLSWQEKYCDMIKDSGGTVETRMYPNDDHFSLPESSVADVMEWVQTRLP